MSLIHGGDIEGYRLEYGGAPLDFSANINPVGLPLAVRRALVESVDQAKDYPDPLCRMLTAALAQRLELPRDFILCGSGAADIIFRLAIAAKPRRALLLAPTFAEYERALQMVGCQVEHHVLLAEDGFAVTESILSCLRPETDMLFICNPNNPTGLTIDQVLLRRILERCATQNIILAVDECFNGLLYEPVAHTLRGSLAEYHHLLILDAFTKLYAMPGLRLGYALSANTKLLAAMRQAGPPWAVSSLAQAAGLAALTADEYLQYTRTIIQEEKAFLTAGLAEAGFEVLSGEANYIFFRSTVPHLAERLREQGILIRDCANFFGLTQGYYRIAIRNRADNLRLLAHLQFLAEGEDE